MFAQHHNDSGTNFWRYFSRDRSSVSSLDDGRPEEFRRHVWAVTMADENPLPVMLSGHSSLTDGPRKLRHKRGASASAAVPSFPQDGRHPKADTKYKRNTMNATVTVRPIHPPSFDRTSEMQTIHEHSVDDFDVTADTSARRPSLPRTPYPMYPGLQTQTNESAKSGPAPPMMLNRPRKLSGSTIGSMSSAYSGESVSSELRSASWGSRATSFESIEGPGWRPGYRKSTPMVTQVIPFQPNELFATLPGEVLDLTLAKLKQLHIVKGSESCATCWARDLCNISLSSRKWSKHARRALYEDVHLVGPDSAGHKKRFKLAQGSRMVLLRRTLRADMQIAGMVRSLKVPRLEAAAGGKGTMSMEQYEDLVATLVRACPNLERLSGPKLSYDHSFKRIVHALSTRTQLKDMHWLIEQSPAQTQRRNQSTPPQQGGLVMPGELQPFQEAQFLEYHQNWTSLTSLSVHCLPGATLTPDTLLTKTLANLPSLQHLHLCNLPPNAFSDRNLLSLPHLQTLSLSHITGITSSGLSSFATRSTSQALRKLHLRHTPLTSLPALARILSNLPSLVNFSLVQAFSPLMPEADSFTLWMMPYLASVSVEKLHWDITSPSAVVNAADDILARSIAAGGFPQLKRLRAPNDPQGSFQGLCRPVDRLDLPSDRFCGRGLIGSIPDQAPASPVTPKSPSWGLQKFPSATSPPPSPSSARPPRCTDLCAARLAAQTRLEDAKKTPRFFIRVTDENGDVAETHDVGTFAGTMGSNIEYYLLPDAGSSDEKGGLVDVRDLGAESGENLVEGREGCTGAWNRNEGVFADKKEREKWWHTERGRWTRVEL